MECDFLHMVNEVFKPHNFNEINIGNKRFAGMAHPIRYNNDNVKDVIKYIKDNNFHVLISLDQGNSEEIAELCKDNNIKHYISDIKDFHAPTLNQLQEISNIVKAERENGNNIAMHCGEGFGRTGTILSFLKLEQDVKDNINDDNTELTDLGEYADADESKQCLKSTKNAIKYVRNNYSPHAVEKKCQLEVLDNYLNDYNDRYENLKISLLNYIKYKKKPWYKRIFTSFKHQNIEKRSLNKNETIYLKSLLMEIYQLKNNSININFEKFSFKSKTIAKILRDISNDICNIENKNYISFYPEHQYHHDAIIGLKITENEYRPYEINEFGHTKLSQCVIKKPKGKIKGANAYL